MADRILTWYLPEVTGDGTNQAATYCLDKSYALPAVVRIYARFAPRGQDLVIDIKDDGKSIFGTHKVSTIKTKFAYSEIEYSSLAVSTFQVNETITAPSGAEGKVISDDALGHMELDLVGTTRFIVDETITGGTSNATANVDAFVLGGTHTKWDITSLKYGAVLPDGLNAEEHAESFANDKTFMEQYSWITLDIVQSGGAKQITVQLELNHEYVEELPDEED